MKIKPKAHRHAPAAESRAKEGATQEKPRLEQRQEKKLPGAQPELKDGFKTQSAGVDSALGSAKLGSTATTSAKQPTVESTSAAAFDPSKLSSQLQQGQKALAQIDLSKAGLKPELSGGDAKSWVSIEGQDADGNFHLRDLNTQESFKLSADKLGNSLTGGVVTVGPIEGELSSAQRAHLSHDIFQALRGLGYAANESMRISQEYTRSLCSYNPSRFGNDGGSALWN